MVDVSVIVPVYNAEAHLKECLESICGQTLENIEIICVDDGSTDGSAEIIRHMAASDVRITLIQQNNAGAGAARNNGLRNARGRYLSFLDADDFFDPYMLEKACKKADDDSADMVVFKADFYNDTTGTFTPCSYGLREGMLPEKRPFAGLDIETDTFKVVVGWAWDKLFKREFILQNNLWFQEQRTSNDLFFTFCALVKAERITTLSEILVHQRRNNKNSLSVTREKSWMCFYEALLAIREQLKAWEVYDRLEQDYINYALHFSLWNLNTLKEPTNKLLYNALRDGWFKELGIVDYPKEKFYHYGEYRQYESIMSKPYNRVVQKITGFGQRGLTWVRRKIQK